MIMKNVGTDLPVSTSELDLSLGIVYEYYS